MKGEVMPIKNEILLALERIEQKLTEIRRSVQSVSTFDICPLWLLAAWTVFVAIYAHFSRTTFGK